MTGFDIAVLVVVGLGAATGFLRGFVHECLVLAAWAIAVIAIHTLLGPLSAFLLPHIHSSSGAAVLAFAILAIVPIAGLRLIAARLGSATRNSVVGPIDRVLGFGFGAVKGTLFVVVACSVVALVYDVAWAQRPEWITASRTYPFINACSDKLVAAIEKRRQTSAQEAATQDGSKPTDAASPDASPDDSAGLLAKPRHHHHRAPQ